MELTRGDLRRLADLVTQRSGMAFPESRWPFLRRQAGGVMARNGFSSVARWAEELERPGHASGKLYADLEEALQVPATRFFRYPEHYEVLGRIVIPALLQDGPAGETHGMRFWSVGCATGEEAYSIAMVVRDSLPAPESRPLEIVGVDASRAALLAAQRGIYRAASVRAVPPALLAKHFLRQNGLFSIAPPVRQLVSFFHHDIRRGFYMGKFAAIFCCNVLLYYTPELRRQILDGLAASLHPGAFLFLGHAEGIAPPPDRFAPVPCAGGFVYRRV